MTIVPIDSPGSLSQRTGASTIYLLLKAERFHEAVSVCDVLVYLHCLLDILRVIEVKFCHLS